MDKSEIVDYYREILTLASNLVPIDWQRLIVGANIDKNDATSLFFFYSEQESPQTFFEGLGIPGKFNIDQSLFDEDIMNIMHKIQALQEWFSKNGQQPFNELMIEINSKGAMHSEIGYIDWSGDTNFDDFDQMDFFRYKYLNDVPEDTAAQNVLKKMQRYENKHK